MGIASHQNDSNVATKKINSLSKKMTATEC